MMAARLPGARLTESARRRNSTWTMSHEPTSMCASRSNLGDLQSDAHVLRPASRAQKRRSLPRRASRSGRGISITPTDSSRRSGAWGSTVLTMRTSCRRRSAETIPLIDLGAPCPVSSREYGATIPIVRRAVRSLTWSPSHSARRQHGPRCRRGRRRVVASQSRQTLVAPSRTSRAPMTAATDARSRTCDAESCLRW